MSVTIRPNLSLEYSDSKKYSDFPISTSTITVVTRIGRRSLGLYCFVVNVNSIPSS